MSEPIAKAGYHHTASWRAGLVRVVFALIATLIGSAMFPSLERGRWVLWAYLGFSCVTQLCIWLRLGAGDTRSLLSGATDALFLTYVVYQLGVVSNVLPAIYLLIPVLHASSSSSRSRVGMRLALLTTAGYWSLLALTYWQVLPYAPARQDLHTFTASGALLALSGALISLSVLVTTNLVSRQVNALGRTNAKLAALSERDELTQLYNRRFLFRTVGHHLARVRRGASMGVMMIDLDGFKRINDVLGHAAGDTLLKAVARGLEDEMREVDLVARFGGDEFVVMLPDLEADGLMTAAQRAVTRIATIGRQLHPALPVTASVGMAMADDHDEVASLMRRADDQAYRAKRAGGNHCAYPPVALEPRVSGEIDTRNRSAAG